MLESPNAEAAFSATCLDHEFGGTLGPYHWSLLFPTKHVQKNPAQFNSSSSEVRKFPKLPCWEISSCPRLLDQTADFGVFHPQPPLQCFSSFFVETGVPVPDAWNGESNHQLKKKQQSRLSLSSFDARNLLVFFQAVDAAAWGLSATASTELRLGRPTGAANQDEINYMAQQTCTSKGSYFFVQQSFHELMPRRLCRTTQKYEPSHGGP